MSRAAGGAAVALRRHWPEFLIEAAGLGVFMMSAGLFATVLEHPASAVFEAVREPWLRRLLMGMAMGGTAAALVYSPWGKRSGAHLNPAFTLTFFRLSRIAGWDAIFYAAAQFAGGLAGLGALRLVLGVALAHPRVNSVVTVPGAQGAGVAFLAELAIAFVLMLLVLVFTNRPRLNRFAGLVVAGLLVTYVTLEAPYSGMSLNPARTFASAVLAWSWTGIWIYFTAPVLGMLGAVEVYARMPGGRRVLCAKLHHDNDQRCIFHCNYPARGAQATGEP